jgi:hypothetical protein
MTALCTLHFLDTANRLRRRATALTCRAADVVFAAPPGGLSAARDRALRIQARARRCHERAALLVRYATAG